MIDVFARRGESRARASPCSVMEQQAEEDDVEKKILYPDAPPAPDPSGAAGLPDFACKSIVALFAFQVINLAVGISVVAVVAGEPVAFRRGFNLGDEQLGTYASMAALSIGFAVYEFALWRSPETDSARARAAIAACWYTTLALCGASLPAVSNVLASDTPVHHTLDAAWIMCTSAASAAAMCVTRRLIPSLISVPASVGDRVPPLAERLVLAAPLGILVVSNSVLHGLSVAAATRPRSTVVEMDFDNIYANNTEALQIQGSIMHDTVRSAILQKRASNPYANVERDAMLGVALLSACATLCWLACAVGVTWPDRYRTAWRRRAMSFLVAGACAAQALLVGAVVPNLAVVSITSTREFADAVKETEPSAEVAWCNDPITYAVGALALAGAIAHLNIWPSSHNDIGFLNR